MAHERPKTVLVAERNELRMKLLCTLLEGHGYNVLRATNDGECYRKAREHCPDLIVFDPISDADEEAFDVIKAIRSTEGLRSIPVAAVLEMGKEDGDEMARLLQCDACIPVDPLSVGAFYDAVLPFLETA